MTQQTEPPQANDFEQDPYAVRLFDLSCKKALPQGVILTIKYWITIRFNWVRQLNNENAPRELVLPNFGAPCHYSDFANRIHLEIFNSVVDQLTVFLDEELTRLENAD